MKTPPPLIAFALGIAFAAHTAFAADTLGRIKSAKTVNVAYNPEALPFSFGDGKAEPRGYSIDLCKRVIAQIGRTVGVPDLKVNWVAGTTPQRLQMVASGKADLECGNTTQTLARMANVDFSSLVFLESGGLLAKAESKGGHLSDLSGKKISVQKGTTTEARLREVLQKRLVNAEVVPVERAADGMAMLESGQADAFAGDTVNLIGLIIQAKEPDKYGIMNEEFSYEPYAFALPRNDSALRLEVNRALSQIYRAGEIQPIYGQWLGPLGTPTDLLKAMYILNVIPE
jgi:glutamate/aspartate transport system substrate-binding protein